MKRGWMILIVFAAAVVLLAPISARAFSYDFGCVISGSGCTPTGTDWGDFSIVNSSTNNVTVSVSVDSGLKLLGFGFNYDGTPAPGTFTFAGGMNIDYLANGIKPDGYPYYFDLDVPGGGNLGNVSSFSDVLSLNGGALTIREGDFDLFDSGGGVTAFAHIGGLNTSIYPAGSIWVGTGTRQVPEPGTLLLLGSGLVGLAVYGRKTFKR